MTDDASPVQLTQLSAATGVSGAGGLAVAAALVYPTLLTLAYFVLLAGFPTVVQQTVYGVGKSVQFLFPVTWVFLIQRERLQWPAPGRRGLPFGIGFGLAVLVAMAVLYLTWFRSSGLFVSVEQQASAKVRDLGLDSPWRFAMTAVFYALAHSALEEYYWRWFVFGQLWRRSSMSVAIVVSSLGFMAHHVVLLGTFLGWGSLTTYAFSLAIAAGGAVWAWLYATSRSLLGPWISHMFVDIAIFVIGYDLVRQSLVGAAG